MPPFFFWDLRSSLLSLFWVLFQVDCLSPLHLIVLIGFRFLGTSLVAQMVKRLSTMWETWVWSLSREDPLEKEMTIHSSTIAWKIPWTEELGRLQSMGSQRVGHDWVVCCSISSSNCCFLTCIQVFRETSKVGWYFHLLKNFPVCCYPHKVFSVVNEAEADIFLEFRCFLHYPMNVGNLISGSSAFSRPSLYIWKFLVHILLKANWRILSIILLACEMSSTA